MEPLIFAIDATNLGTGGGVTHLAELLDGYEGPEPVILIAQQRVLDKIADQPLVRKIGHPLLEKGLLHRILFQLFRIDRFIPHNALVFAVTGDYLGRRPVVGMSQNMMLYERDQWREIRSMKESLRVRFNAWRQVRCFRSAAALVFISDYAKEYVTRSTGLQDKKATIIHHGIAPRFFGEIREQRPIGDYSEREPFTFVYISSVHVYKHQWNVVEAVAMLRKKGYPVALELIGSVLYAPSGLRMGEAIRKADPEGVFIRHFDDLPYETIQERYRGADAFVFASTCENMPNILLEAMASGTPVACSDKMPMPEFLKEAGFYFDALDPASIADALESLLQNPAIRERRAAEALAEARKFSWQEARQKTFGFLREVHTSRDNQGH